MLHRELHELRLVHAVRKLLRDIGPHPRLLERRVCHGPELDALFRRLAPVGREGDVEVIARLVELDEHERGVAGLDVVEPLRPHAVGSADGDARRRRQRSNEAQADLLGRQVGVDEHPGGQGSQERLVPLVAAGDDIDATDARRSQGFHARAEPRRRVRPRGVHAVRDHDDALRVLQVRGAEAAFDIGGAQRLATP